MSQLIEKCPECGGCWGDVIITATIKPNGRREKFFQCLQCNKIISADRVTGDTDETFTETDYAKTALEIVAVELGKAKGKHPEFPVISHDAISVIMEELGELAMAANDCETNSRLIEEAAHVAVTAIRFIEERLK